jgi:hypothetical protein
MSFIEPDCLLPLGCATRYAKGKETQRPAGAGRCTVVYAERSGGDFGSQWSEIMDGVGCWG